MKLKRQLESAPELLLTPLIDMIFLVVIFFMINAGLTINPAIKVTLPEAYSSTSSLEKELIVTITAEGGIYIEERLVAPEDFASVLQGTMEKMDAKVVYFQGDENIPYKKLVEVMDIARSAGVEMISLLTSVKQESR